LIAVANVYVDTNVFILAFENNDLRAEKLLELISLNSESRAPFLGTSELALAELMIEPLRNRDDHLIELYDNLVLGNAFVEVGTVSREVLWRASMLRANHKPLRLPDAIHISTAMNLSCARFLTADERLRGDYSIAPDRRSQPRFAPSGPVSTMRPEIPVTEGLIREFSA